MKGTKYLVIGALVVAFLLALIHVGLALLFLLLVLWGVWSDHREDMRKFKQEMDEVEALLDESRLKMMYGDFDSEEQIQELKRRHGLPEDS